MKGLEYNIMIMDDICLCGSINCPRYDECARGDGYKHPTTEIFTVSNFAEICNQNNNYKEFIGVKNDKRI